MFLLIGKIVVLLTATNRFNFGKHVVTGVAVFIYSVKRTFKGREKFVALQISKQISSFSFFFRQATKIAIFQIALRAFSGFRFL